MVESFARLSRLGRKLGACRAGNSAIEFGLSAPFLILIVFGAYDYGSAYVEGVRLTGAARAGAQMSLYDPTDWDNTALAEQAALEEYEGRPLTSSEIATLPVSAAASTFCGCSDGVTLDCSATCPSGDQPGRFLRVRLSRAVPLTLPYPWAPDGQYDVDRDAVVRAR
jgi:TadE-like protein